jgi:hypothetical protein
MASGLVARNAVRKLLQSSPSYRELPPDRQREIAHNTTRVASYMADPNGLLSKKPRSRAYDARARQPRAATTLALGRGARALGPAAAHLAVLGDPRVLDASAAAAALLQAVDFPDFIGDLIKSVFNSVVDSSIKQMEAYAELIKQVSDTVDRFERDSISAAQARDWLAQRFALQLELDPRGRLRWRVDPHVGARDLSSALLISSPAADTRDLMAAARRRMAIDRQQLLATMVTMGINRVVVTDGKIAARGSRAN